MRLLVQIIEPDEAAPRGQRSTEISSRRSGFGQTAKHGGRQSDQALALDLQPLVEPSRYRSDVLQQFSLVELGAAREITQTVRGCHRFEFDTIDGNRFGGYRKKL